MKPRSLVNIVVVIFFSLGVYTMIDEFFKQSSSFGELTPNTLCLDYERPKIKSDPFTSNSNPLLEPLKFRLQNEALYDSSDGRNTDGRAKSPSYEEVTRQLCDLPEKAQFSKFIWVITDGWPRVFAEEVFEHYSDHSSGHSVIVPGLKLSHAIYISWFTGEPSMMHWMSREMSTYNLWDALFAANYEIDYLGKERSMMNIIGSSRRQKLKSIHFVDETNVPQTQVHPHLFDNLEESLNASKDKSRSLIAFSALYDTWMHKHGWQDPAVKGLSDKLVQNMKRIKKWIDENPDYLLIISTDHGVDGFGNLLHGHTMKGNNGFVLFYNPRLPKTQEMPIDVVDVAPTISGYLKGVDIPPTSVGRTRTVFPPEFSRTSSQMLLKQNLLQLYALATHQQLEIDPSITFVVESLLESSSLSLSAGSNPATDERAEEIEEAVNKLKEKLYRMSSLSVKTFLLNLIGFCTAFYVIITKRNSSLVSHIRSRSPKAILHFIYLVIIYLPAFASAWSILTWHIDHRLGYGLVTVSALMSPTYVLLMLRWIYTQDFSFALHLIQNEVINALFIAFSFCVPKEISMNIANQTPLWVLYAMGFWAIYKVYSHLDTSGISLTSSGSSNNLNGLANNSNLNNVVSSSSSSSSNNYKKEALFYQMVLVCMYIFENTSHWSWAYFIIGFHFIAFFIYVALTFSFGRALYKTQTELVHVFVPVSMLLFFLLHRSTYDRLLLFVFNYQFLYCLAPLIKKLFKTEEQQQVSPDKTHAGTIELLSQSSLMLVFNQIIFHFTVVFQNNFDINVDPFTGRVGRVTFDVFPLLSAAFMAFAKYGIFILFISFLWFLYGSHSDKSYYTPILLFVMHFTTLNVVFHEMLWRYMMPDKITEVLVSSVSWGVLAIMYVAIDALKRSKRGSIGRLKLSLPMQYLPRRQKGFSLGKSNE